MQDVLEEGNGGLRTKRHTYVISKQDPGFCLITKRSIPANNLIESEITDNQGRAA